jgi:hypothetical protein
MPTGSPTTMRTLLRSNFLTIHEQKFGRLRTENWMTCVTFGLRRRTRFVELTNALDDQTAK